MSPQQAAALYIRRGTLVEWIHTIPPDPAGFDPATGGPKALLGGPRMTNVGNFGETFLPPVIVNAYFQSKTTSFSQQPFGQVDIGDGQLTFVVPYVPTYRTTPLFDANPTADPPVVATTPSLSDYNLGNFANVQGPEGMRFDRFTLYGSTYVAKAVPVPLSDGDCGVFAWRLLVGKVGV